MYHPDKQFGPAQPETPGARTLPRLTFLQRNQRRLLVLCAMATLAWTAQLAAGWYKPHSDIGLSQHKKIELAHILQFEWRELNRASRPESKPDPVALDAANASQALPGPGLALRAISSAARLNAHNPGLPAIRAPPSTLPVS